MTAYKVVARRWKRGWELHIDGVGVTQSKTLADAQRMIRDYIALDHEIPADSFGVEIVPEIDDALDKEILEARAAVKKAETAQREAGEFSRQVARKLRARSLTGRDIAAVLRVSPQRVSQLLKTKS